MKKNIILLVTAALFCAQASLAGAENIKALKGKGGPIEITSDRLDAYEEQRLVVFSGNVVAVQEDKTIYCDKLSIFYKKESGAERKGSTGRTEAGGGDLERIEAAGRVKIVQLNRVVTGEKAVYLQDDQKITVTGNPVLTEGENVIKGDRVVVLLNENKGIVESSKQKRVTAVIKTEGKGTKK